jgi:hypothetical protein
MLAVHIWGIPWGIRMSTQRETSRERKRERVFRGGLFEVCSCLRGGMCGVQCTPQARSLIHRFGCSSSARYHLVERDGCMQ